jgi:surfactin synthase thioesterase subunit
LCRFCISADQCPSPPVQTHACGRYKIHDDEEEHFQLESAATTFCNKLLQNPSFAACRAVSTYAGTSFVIQTYLDGLKQNFLCAVYIFFSKLSLKMQQHSVMVWHTIFSNSFSHRHGFPGLAVFFSEQRLHV